MVIAIDINYLHDCFTVWSENALLSIPLFTESNGGNPQNVATASGDTLLGVGVLVGNTVRIVVDATVTAPVEVGYGTNPGRYLGEIIVHDII